jgi:hypothetical protein
MNYGDPEKTQSSTRPAKPLNFEKEKNMDRRSFFSNMMAVAAFSGAVGEVFTPKELMAAAEEAADTPTGAHQQFWNGFFDDVDPTKPHATGARGPGGEPMAQPLTAPQ